MRIGLVVYGSLDRITGGNIYDRELVTRLRARGDAVEVISIGSRGLLAHALDNLRLPLPAQLDVLLQDELTHLSMLLPTRHRRSYPVASIVHNLHSSERRPRWQNALWRTIERSYLEAVDGIVFNSRATLESVRHGLNLDKRSVVAPPGGDRLGTLTSDLLAARIAASGPLRLLLLANVTRLKGLHVLLDALSVLQPERFTLDVVGSFQVEPDYASTMQTLAARLGLPVTFHGVLDGKALRTVMERADVMVVPSYYEGFGIAFLEGMAFGLPAVGTLSGAMPEMIKQGVNGFLIPPGDSSALARCLSALDSDRALLRQVSSAALEFFHLQPTWEDSARIIREFLDELAQDRRSD